ncbi:LPXTG cell wall anchor domain-containing protein, partial [Kitasatospora sp. NPDC052868]|uniref:LPXTG cell wall anchor domain-containing protein n=1 Tax=Kitasatospora sp. NPDC052868 TaxID=3364060 RepID=UPI0037C7763A
NAATAHGTPPTGSPVTTPPSTAEVTATKSPASPKPTQHPHAPVSLPNTGAGSVLYAMGAILLLGLGTLTVVAARARRLS